MILLGSSLKLCQSGLNIISTITAPFHTLNRSNLGSLTSILQNAKFLVPTVVDFVPSCGFKVKGLVRRRCKDCYLVRREERMFNLCKTHQRHKQMSMVKKPHNTWILSHATQGKVRPW